MDPVFDSAIAVNGVVEADLGPIDVFDADADWSDREVTAVGLAKFLHANRKARRVFIRGARIVQGKGDPETVDLTDFRSKAALVLRNCFVEKPFNLDDGITGRLEFRGCDLRQGLRLQNSHVHGGLLVLRGTQVGSVNGVSVSGSGATIEGDVATIGEHTRLDGALRLRGATIGGQLYVSGGAHIATGPHGWAIDADGLTVAQSLFIVGEHTRLDGALRLGGATIGGQFGVRGGAQLAGGFNDWAIDADGLKVAVGLFIEGQDTRLQGALRIRCATIGGQFGVRGGAQIASGPDGWAIDADGLTVAQNLSIQGEHSRLGGGLRLRGATIGGELDVGDGAQVGADSNGWAIDVDGTKVAQHLHIRDEHTRLDGGLYLRNATIGGQFGVRRGAQVFGGLNVEGGDVAILVVRSGTIDGVVDLSNARVRRLLDSPCGWKKRTGGYRLSGITIEALSGTLHGDGGWSTKERINWLRKDATRSRRPFTQVAGLYRQAGHHTEARRIAMAGEETTSGWWRRVWAGKTIGYGYQPWQAAWIAVALVVLAWIATSPRLAGDGLFVATSGEEGAACPYDHACLNRFVYMAETVVPVVAFGQRDAWRINTTTLYGELVQVGQYVLDGLGWLLALLVVAAVSGVVRRD